MATIAATELVSEVQFNSRYLYEAMGNADSGEAITVRNQPDGSIQVIGTFGGATVALEGSNDGANWVTLTDDSATAIEFTAAGLKMFLPRTWKIRATTTGGTGTDVDVYILLGA